MKDASIKAVLGPTNTGKTHLAIERMCAHSSGVIGFPLRLLAREVYDRLVAIKGEKAVALITGEQRIEPAGARYLCCTVEAMPRSPDAAFVALDEAQLSADRERGHVFTDRLLNARGREETMLLGAATLEPMVKALVPDAEISDRPRFSTLTHIGPRKLSRLPPRSAIVAFSSEAVYAVAEMLRRFRGGAAVVMGALSPETRNKQVELFQNGEVDYIVATDAIGMGLNLDVNHVAFAGLTKFDGVRMRRLHPAEMAQIAGRAGRHQRDGTFGTLAGAGGKMGPAPEFTEEEVYAIEEHRFAPITKLFWREAEPRFDNIATLIGDLETPPRHEALRLAPEAIDLATLKRLAEEPFAATIRGHGQVRRFWEACSLPDFRQRGPDVHARFVARLWQDLQQGYIGADFVAARISELDNTSGDIDTLQGRIAAIRSWAYICQRPDWVLARDEMASRARAVEAKLSDALHARLTERFVNRRTAILMKSLGQDASMLPITLTDDGILKVEDEPLGHVEGFRFVVDAAANHADRKMLLAAAEKALPRLLGERADALAASGMEEIEIGRGAIRWKGQMLAKLRTRDGQVKPELEPARELASLSDASRANLMAALDAWLDKQLEPLEPLRKMHIAATNPDAGSQARALLLNLISGHGFVTREKAGIEHLPKEMRPFLRKIGVTFGALDIYSPMLLKPAPRQLLHALGIDRRPLQEAMLPVIPDAKKLPSGYRHAGSQAIRLDLAEKIFRSAHEARAKADKSRKFRLDLALPISIGLEEKNAERLLGQAGFRVQRAKPLAEGAFGPPRPDSWEWRPSRRKQQRSAPAASKPREGSAFAGLADLMKQG
ncbi:helicase-related protein [Qipengyuania nanhaisediminis]|uniref:ATP-dependent RNA helicase SUPV3L1/SUV3 n=1 Tax=Qipengyuania nanhaisediminis TaxID=604088 RepID=A0A1I5KY32_9SPHN|nr:helicase-related protein [Qipengyuania nanhaisediminis]SFO89371.1 ATP-dependent RNA helicase SUPV3L1/SUV3 [Qipengyuania nanhaisediminis]